MPDNTYAEILSVTADTTQFAKDLETLEALWNSFVDRVGKDNIGAAFSAGMFDGINKGLGDIKDVLVSLSTKVAESMETMANNSAKSVRNVKDAVKEAQEAAQEAADKIDRQLAKSQEETRKRNEKRVRDFNESKQQAEESANTFDEQKQVRSFAETKEKAQILANELNDKADAQEDIRADKRRQKLEEEANKQNRSREAAASKREREMNQMFDSNNEEPDTRTATQDEFESAREQLEQERSKQRQREEDTAFSEHEREQQEHERRGYDDTTGYYPENETGSPKPKFDEPITRKNPKEGGGIFGDLGGDLANIAKITVEFQLISTILNKLGELVTAPFRAIAEGEEYLKKTEMDAVDLEGSLLSSVKYSDNLRDNLKNVQEGSVAVTKALQDVVVANPNIKLEDLQNSFKVISETLGGTGGVDTLQKMVQLSQDFSLAMRGAGVSTGNTRRLASELPQLFEGTLKPTSALARALGQTPAQLHQLVEEGIKFNDIEERFAPLLAPFIQQAQDAKTTLEGTEDAAKLLADRLTGAYSNTGVEAYKQELQELINKMNDPSFAKHAQQLGEWATLWGEIKAATSSIPAFIAALSTGQDNLARKMGFDPDGKGGYKHTNGGYDSESGWSSSSGVTSGTPDLPLLGNPAIDILRKQLVETNTKPTLGKKSSLPFDTSLMSSELEDYRAKLDAIKRVFDGVKEDNELLVSGGSQNKSQASDAVSTASKEASAQILRDAVATAAQLNASHKKELDNISSVAKENQGTKTDSELVEEVNKKKQEANKRYHDAETALSKSTTDALAALLSSQVTAEREAAQEKQQIQKANFEASIAMAKRESDARIEAAQNAASIIEQLYGFGLASQSDVQGAKRNVLSTKQSALADEQRSINSSFEFEKGNTAEGGAARNDAANRYTSATASIALQQLQVAKDITEQTNDAAEKKRISEEATLSFLMKSIALAKQYKDASNELKESGRSLIDSVSGNPHSIEPALKDRSVQRESDIAAIRMQQTGLSSRLAVTAPGIEHDTLQDAINRLDTDIKLLSLGPVSDAHARIEDMRKNTPELLQGPSARGILNSAIANVKKNSSSSDSDEQKTATEEILTQLNSDLSELGNSSVSAGSALLKVVLASNEVATNFKGISNSIKSVGVDINLLTQSVLGAYQAYQSGKQQGGILGGIGGVASSVGNTASTLSKTLGNSGLGEILKTAGPYAEALGSVLSLVGSIFTAEAQHIVDNINNQFTATMAGLTNGQNGINQTLQAVMMERTDAIQQLSGVKGGQDQLSKILPQLNQEIAQLQAQQIQASQSWGATFNELTMQLQTGSAVGSQIMQNWVSINQQVYNYVNATGDATSATQFLSMTLQQLQITSQQQLTAGEEQAVQSAIALNQQLLQRTQLIDSLNQQAFALQNQDSEERTQSGSVTRAQQLQLLQQQSQQQLQSLNFQITQSQQVVTAYSTVFSLSQDIADLWAQSNKDTLDALQIQLNGYKQLQQVISSITQGSNGLFSSSQNWLNPVTNPVTNGTTITLAPGSIVVNITDNGGDLSSVTADSISSALMQAARSGTPIGT